LNAEHAKAWKDIWSAGHGVTSIEKKEPVTDLVAKLKQQYKTALLQNVEKLKSLK
jgi:nitronate monooxygenase